jgi:hypothetical protein
MPIRTNEQGAAAAPTVTPTQSAPRAAGGGLRNVSRESKVLIGVGAVAALGLILAVSQSLTLGLFIILAGIAVGILSYRFLHEDVSDPFADARTAADEAQVGNITPSQPLAPWSPDGGLNAWTPPVTFTSLPDAPPAPPAADLAPPSAPTFEPTEPAPAWSDDWSSGDSWNSPAPATWDAPPSSTETNPLDELQGFDTLDPIAEVERIEGRAADDGYAPAEPAPAEETFTTFSFGNASHFVNEDVSDADDIMAASQATELHLANGEQTELQKLLAKVQIRLSAYE